MNVFQNNSIVITLDGAATNLVFSGIRGVEELSVRPAMALQKLDHVYA